MTNAEQLDAEGREFLEGLRWRMSLMEGRRRIDAAKAAERAAAEQREAERGPEYRRAAEASLAVERPLAADQVRLLKPDYVRSLRPPRETVDSALAKLQRHAVDLSFDEPRVRIEWLELGTKSGELVGIGNAIAFRGVKTIACPPITDVSSYVIALHEIAHCRDKGRGGRLEGEVFAWKWAREHALVWNEQAQNRMTSALSSYLRIAKGDDDILGAIAAERFMSKLEYQREVTRRWLLETGQQGA
jgi:hypothetical protein